MEITDIKTAPHFDKQYKKLTKKIKELAKEKEKIFRQNPFDPCLKTHKLHGKQEELWAFSINYSYRIIFTFTAEQEVLFLKHAIMRARKQAVLFLEIGAHDKYT